MLPIDLLPASHLDFNESFGWYSNRSLDVAARFANAINLALEEIARDPERFAHIDDRHRARIVKKFPFRIIYRTAENRIIVVAIAHAKRKPNYWHSR